MTITGSDISAIALRAAGYLDDLSTVSVAVSPAAGAEFAAAANAAKDLATNTAECDSIATTVTTLSDAITGVWDYLATKGHPKATKALKAK